MISLRHAAREIRVPSTVCTDIDAKDESPRKRIFVDGTNKGRAPRQCGTTTQRSLLQLLGGLMSSHETGLLIQKWARLSLSLSRWAYQSACQSAIRSGFSSQNRNGSRHPSAFYWLGLASAGRQNIVFIYLLVGLFMICLCFRPMSGLRYARPMR